MRLPNRLSTRFLALGLTALLASCGRGGNDVSIPVSAAEGPASLQSGPAADYPVVVGDPYYIGDTLFTPIDTMNYDEVGYAGADAAGGEGVTVSHRTLPMPSYVEITALDSGKTILARVERRGPMVGNAVVGLSNGAQRQLDVANGAPIRIRRVNSAEVDRAKLRVGEAAPARMDTPKSLLAVLKRKLPEAGVASLAVAQTAPQEPAVLPAKAPPAAPKITSAAKPSATPFERAFSAERKVVTSYPLAPLGTVTAAATAQRPMPTTRVTDTDTSRTDAPKAVAPSVSPPAEATPTQAGAPGSFVIQAAAFSSKDNAERVASSIDGFVQKAGRYYRVRKGPFANRGQAEAALAKLRAAGYSDARVFTAG